ncbi:MAG TPA: hypothetical protein IAB55_08340 [Candidatus Merdivicinus faecavium]|nr:hypothetical protein [Candidatus Merdivicinus faecavium]
MSNQSGCGKDSLAALAEACGLSAEALSGCGFGQQSASCGAEPTAAHQEWQRLCGCQAESCGSNRNGNCHCNSCRNCDCSCACGCGCNCGSGAQLVSSDAFDPSLMAADGNTVSCVSSSVSPSADCDDPDVPVLNACCEKSHKCRLCCDQNGCCRIYPCTWRNSFWPEFTHPRWLCCRDLYNVR